MASIKLCSLSIPTMTSFDRTFREEHPVPGQAKTIKTCECCGMNMLIPVPPSAKEAQKYCKACQPSVELRRQPLPDYSHLIDPLRMNEIKMSEVNAEYGADLNRRQRLQLAWTQSFNRELDTLERKQREMKIRMGGRYAKRG